MGFKKASTKKYQLADKDSKKLYDWSKLEKVDEIIRRIKKHGKT